VVITKKKRGMVIDNPIGAMFRGINIMEYKSPADHLSIQGFHKVGAYARLYSVQNGIDTGDMTISFVTASYPRRLFDYLKREYRFKVSERQPGIYYVEGDIFPIQIIETKRLEGERGGIWLKELRAGQPALTKEYPKSAAFGPEEANCTVVKTSTLRQAVLPDVLLSCLALMKSDLGAVVCDDLLAKNLAAQNFRIFPIDKEFLLCQAIV
jgi:hypothetical protein